MLALIGAAHLTGCTDTAIDPAKPAADAEVAAPAPIASIIRLPLSVSTATLQRFAEQAVPPTVSGEKALGNFGPAADNRLTWSFARSPITITGQGGALAVTTAINGGVTVRGSIQPIRGDVGRLLGNLRPSQPYSQSADVGVDFAGSLAPSLRADWSVEPGLAARASVREATARIAGRFDISFRGEVQRPLDEAVNRAVEDGANRIRADRSLRREAERAWTTLCEPVPLRLPDGMPPLALAITPLAVLATQPAIAADGVRLDLGLDAVLRLGPPAAEPAPCPPFPETLVLAPSLDGGTRLSVDATLDAATMTASLETWRKADPVWETDSVRIEVDRLAIEPHGDRLLLAVTGRFVETDWFGASARGTVYLTARPELNAAERSLRFSAVDLDAQSEDALGSVLASVGVLLEPLLVSRVDDLTVDLSGLLETARAEADAAVKGLGPSLAGLALRTAEVDDVALANLWVGDDALHVTAEAALRLEVEVTEINP